MGLPQNGFLGDPARTTLEMQNALDDLVDALNDPVSGLGKHSDDSSTLNGASESVNATADTIVKRDQYGNVKSFWSVSEGTQGDNVDVGGILTKNSANDGYIRGSSLADVKSALNKTATNWVLKWSGSAINVTNSWGDGVFMVSDDWGVYTVHVRAGVAGWTGGTSRIDGLYPRMAVYVGSVDMFQVERYTASGPTQYAIKKVWKAE